MIIFKTFIQTLPPGLEESAMIDGANEFSVYWKIVFPLCMPIVAAIGMFSLIGQWNSFFDVMIYNFMVRRLYTLQYYLYMFLMGQAEVSIEIIKLQGQQKVFSTKTLTMATTVISMVPVMIVYPFIQRYFKSGLLVGAVKA
jgi:putative aldouronate transport system permease protein